MIIKKTFCKLDIRHRHAGAVSAFNELMDVMKQIDGKKVYVKWEMNPECPDGQVFDLIVETND